MSEINSIRDQYFITVPKLHELLVDGKRLIVLLDIRFEPGGPSQRPDYEKGHIPGAYFVDLQRELAGVESGYSGRRPLPAADDIQKSIRGWGINDDTLVVVYGNHGGVTAARGWWVLKWAGVANVRFLDGGWEAWLAAGLESSSETPGYRDSNFIVRPGNLPTIDADTAHSVGKEGFLLDARSKAQYTGEEQGTDPVSGHIPGAYNLPGRSHFDEKGHFLSEEAIRRLYATYPVETAPIGAYCGGGVGAANIVLALHSIGIEVPLFVGSWSAWAAEPGRPVEKGLRSHSGVGRG